MVSSRARLYLRRATSSLAAALVLRARHPEQLGAGDDPGAFGGELEASRVGQVRVEVQLYRVPNQALLDAYLADPRRLELTAERERVVARTELFRVPRT